MVISQIRSLYRDENDLFRTVIKRIYEQWNETLQQWDLLKIEFIYEAPDYPLRSDRPEETVEERHGWMIPPAWDFGRRCGSMSGSWSRKLCMTMGVRLPLFGNRLGSVLKLGN